MAMHRRRKADERGGADAGARRHGLRPVLADLDPDRDRAPGLRRPGAAGLHRIDAAAAGRGGRPGQRHRRLADHGRPGHAARHAHRRAGRHLPGRIRPALVARPRHAVHQRHPAVGAVHRDRPVHLRRGGGADEELLGLRRRAGAGADRHPGGRAHHGDDAVADPERAARGRLCAGHAEVEGDLPR